MTDVPVKFIITVVRPDQRQYRQQEVELVCQQEMQVLVPLTNENVANSEELIQWQLGNVNTPKPNAILTVTGLKYVIDQFDNVFLKVEEKEATKTDDEDWGDDLPPSKPAPAKPAAVVEEDWDNDTKTPDEVPWDESTEEWQ